MEKLSRKPLPTPHKKREKYRALNEVVKSMMSRAMMTTSEDIIMAWRRPM